MTTEEFNKLTQEEAFELCLLWKKKEILDELHSYEHKHITPEDIDKIISSQTYIDYYFGIQLIFDYEYLAKLNIVDLYVWNLIFVKSDRVVMILEWSEEYGQYVPCTYNTKQYLKFIDDYEIS